MTGSSQTDSGESGSSSSTVPPILRKYLLYGILLAGAAIGIAHMLGKHEAPQVPAAREKSVSDAPESQDPHSEFVGSQQCAACHQEQFQNWKQSTHGKAGGPANRETVISRFDRTVLRFKDAVVRLSVDADEAHWFEVSITNQAPQRFRADYVVGGGFVHGGGGQSYFSRFPDGTLRLLPFEWINLDGPWFVQTRTRHWQPVSESVSIFECTSWPPHRVLGDNQNFEQNCNNCHGSQLTSTYDPVKRRHETRFTSLSINCESCHGPGRRHIERVSDPAHVRDPDIGMQSLAVLDKDASIQICMQCHGVKHSLSDEPYLPGKDFDQHFTTKIHSGFTDEFHPDGRIRGFQYQKNHLFSDCYINGSMSCVDCHDPHSLHYRDFNRAPLEGKFDDRQCTTCHASKAEDITAHTFHKPESEGSRCTACHMPFYRHPPIGPALGFERSDHAIASPRPAHDASLGLDNACSQCHRDKTVEELDQLVQEWFGPLKPHKPVVRGMMAADHLTDPDEAAAAMLHTGIPIADVAAISEYLKRFVKPGVSPSPETLERFRAFAASSDLDVQAMGMTALHLVHGDAALQGEGERAPSGEDDRATALKRRRILALRLLGDAWLEEGEVARARVAYRKGVGLDATDATLQLKLAQALLSEGLREAALLHLRKAVKLAPYHTGVQNNAGVFLAQSGLHEEAVACFRRVTETNRDDPVFHHNLGQALVRIGKTEEAVDTFRKVIQFDPRHANALISLGTLLMNQGEAQEATSCFEAAEQAAPEDVYVLMRLVDIHWNRRRGSETLRLLRLAYPLAVRQFGPEDPRSRDIQQRLAYLQGQVR